MTKKDPLKEKQFNDELKKIVPVIDRYIQKKANKLYETQQEILDYKLSVGVNLLGNMASDEAQQDPNFIRSFISQSIKNLIAWTELRLNTLTEKKDVH